MHILLRPDKLSSSLYCAAPSNPSCKSAKAEACFPDRISIRLSDTGTSSCSICAFGTVDSVLQVTTRKVQACLADYDNLSLRTPHIWPYSFWTCLSFSIQHWRTCLLTAGLSDSRIPKQKPVSPTFSNSVWPASTFK